MTKKLKLEAQSDVSGKRAKIKSETINRIDKNTKDFRIAYIKKMYSEKNTCD